MERITDRREVNQEREGREKVPMTMNRVDFFSRKDNETSVSLVEAGCTL
jgi:hypothetical protein